MSLYIALGSATGALGGPCESPSEMASRCRLRKTTTGEEDGRRSSIYTRPRRSSGFQPSSEKSTLTREIAIAQMRQLALTPLQTEHRAEVLSHGRDQPRSPSTQWASRGRAATMPELNPPTPDYIPSAPIPIPRRRAGPSMGNIAVHADADRGHARPPRRRNPPNRPSPRRETDEEYKRRVSAMFRLSWAGKVPRFRDFVLMPKSVTDPYNESQRRDSGLIDTSEAALRAHTDMLTRNWMEFAERVLIGEIRGRTRERVPRRTTAPWPRAMSWCGGDEEGHESASEADREGDSS